MPCANICQCESENINACKSYLPIIYNIPIVSHVYMSHLLSTIFLVIVMNDVKRTIDELTKTTCMFYAILWYTRLYYLLFNRMVVNLLVDFTFMLGESNVFSMQSLIQYIIAIGHCSIS